MVLFNYCILVFYCDQDVRPNEYFFVLFSRFTVAWFPPIRRTNNDNQPCCFKKDRNIMFCVQAAIIVCMGNYLVLAYS